MDSHSARFEGLHSRFLHQAGPGTQVPAWFVALTRLSVAGDGIPDTLEGVVRAHVQDDGGTTFDYRVQRRGGLVRCTGLDGGVHMIAGPVTIWTRHDGTDELRARLRARGAYPPDDYEFGTSRPEEDRWVGDDFTVPAGPANETTFLGRRAYRVELAAPERKPYPMHLVFDAQTGLILREGNDSLGTFHEWTELNLDAELPDELFALQPEDRAGHRYS